MNRPYDRKFLYALTEKIYKKVPDVSIGADILLGFPGESDECFQNTFSLLNDLPVTYLHVFPYSPRQNTPAAKFKDQVNGKTTKQRASQTRELGNIKKLNFYKDQSGKVKKVLFENERDKKTGLLKGFSENYVQTQLNQKDDFKNKIVKVKTKFNEKLELMESVLVK